MYVGAKLARLFPDEGRAARATRRMAEAGGDFLVERAKHNTPVDTGELRESWHRSLLRESVDARGDRAYASGAATDVEYAPYVEHGTGLWGPKHAKYPIVPKKPGGVLAFYWGKVGRVVFLSRVMHPGAKGQPMIAPAVMAALAAWPSYMEPELERFMAEYRRTWEREAVRSRAAVRAARAA